MHKFKELMNEAVEKHLPREKMEKITDILACYLHDVDKDERHKMYFDLDVAINGWKLSEEQAKHSVEDMESEHCKGEHWSCEQVEQYARTKGIDFNKEDFNKYELYWAMNMAYHDYYGIIEKYTTDTSKTTEFYYDLAMDFLDDEDAKEGKVKRYIYFIAD